MQVRGDEFLYLFLFQQLPFTKQMQMLGLSDDTKGGSVMIWWAIFGIYYLAGMVYVDWLFKTIVDAVEDVNEYKYIFTQEEINEVNEITSDLGNEIYDLKVMFGEKGAVFLMYGVGALVWLPMMIKDKMMS
jgi:hypothetical protein